MIYIYLNICHNLGLIMFSLTSDSNARDVVDQVVVYDYIYSTHNSNDKISY